MSFPNSPDKYDHPSLLSAARVVAYRREKGLLPDISPPQSLILCYQNSLLSLIRERHPIQDFKGFYSDTFLLEDTHGKVAVASNFGIGAPASVVVMEEFVAFGIKKFISIGTAGGLQEHLDFGDLVVCTQAIRDEGTSHHYLEPSKFSTPSQLLTQGLIHALEQNGRSCISGPSWTTDALYRETLHEVQRYLAEGVQTVEMEASALFAVGAFLDVGVAAAFSISDLFSNGEWHPGVGSERTRQSLYHLFLASLSALADDAAFSNP